MPGKVVIFTEELSMKVYLEILLPRIMGNHFAFQVVPFEGKSDLDKNLERKLRNWLGNEVQFVVLRDQDGRDCKELKHLLSGICEKAGKKNTLIRIVCNELESWHLADLHAVALAYGLPHLPEKHQNKRVFRNPDIIQKPSQKLKQIVTSYQKVGGSREIAKYVNVEKQNSPSFQLFIQTIINIMEQAKAK